jgi:hypothetical protein
MPRHGDAGQSLLGGNLPPCDDAESPADNNAKRLPLEVAPPREPTTCPKLSHSKLVTSWLPVLLLGGGTALALAVWPLGITNLTWPSDAECEAGASILADQGRRVLENAVGTAPAWLRSTLLVAVGTQLLAGMCGFASCRPLWRLAQRVATCWSGGSADATAAIEDTQAANLRLELLLSELQSGSSFQHAEELCELVGGLRRSLAVAELQKRSLLRLLLTGHGLNPAPRRGAGWLAIADTGSPQATWDDARLGLGLTVQQACGVSITKLVCWHWVQPFCYLWVFSAYYCQLSQTGTISQRNVGEIVAARELLYFATTVTAAFACPVYLLADISTVWHEAVTLEQKIVRTACYLLTPHNFVALSLANRFRRKQGEGWLSVNGNLELLFYVVAFAQVIADFASCFALGTLAQQCSGNGFCPAALIVGFSFTAISFFLFFGPVSVYQTYKHVREKGMKGGAAVGGILLLLGLIWVAIGGILLASGEDIYCSWYTFSDTKCGEHGMCFSGNCECIPGFHGEYCETAGQVGQCTTKQMRNAANGLHNQTAQHCGDICCAGVGVCSALNEGSCVCVGEYTGEFCELDPCDPVEVCSRHGSCDVNRTGHACFCANGWRGNACAQGTGCDLAPDCGHGSCVAHGGDHTCVCEDGWRGNACAQGTGCDGNPCGAHGTCTADGTSHTCVCDNGWCAVDGKCMQSVGDHHACAFTISGTDAHYNGLYIITSRIGEDGHTPEFKMDGGARMRHATDGRWIVDGAPGTGKFLSSVQDCVNPDSTCPVWRFCDMASCQGQGNLRVVACASTDSKTC